MTQPVLCLIPCYNVASYCEEIIEESLRYCDALIVIDDGSSDHTGRVLEDLQKIYPDRVEVIRFEHNRGKGFALLEGMEYALKKDFSTLITLDSDKQHAPSEIPKIVEKVSKKTPLAIGTRAFQQMPLRSKFSNAIISKMLSWIYPNAPKDTQSGFRGFHRTLIEQLVLHLNGGRYETEFQILLFALKQKIEIASVPIATLYAREQLSYFRKFSDSIRILKTLFHHWRES